MKFKSLQFDYVTIGFYETALHAAVKSGSPEIIKLLLGKKGIDVDIKDSNGKKPIDYSKNDNIRLMFKH